MTDPQDLAIVCARLAWAKKAENIMVIDVRELTDITDFLVIATVSSSAQSKALVSEIRKTVRENEAYTAFRATARDSTWVLLDYYDVVVDIFEPKTRSFYDLAHLWGDGPRVKWEDKGAARNAKA